MRRGDQKDPIKPLTDAQEEAFCVAVASGQEVHGAYKSIFGKTGKPQAFSLRERDDIDARIAHLQEKRADQMMEEARAQVSLAHYTKETAMAEAEAARTLAMQLLDPRAAVAAIGVKAKLAGHMNETAKPPTSLRDLPLSSLEAIMGELRDRRMQRLMAAAGSLSEGSPDAEP